MYSYIVNVCYIIPTGKKWLFNKMTLEEIRTLCRHGKIGLVPEWKGYIKYNYGLNEL